MLQISLQNVSRFQPDILFEYSTSNLDIFLFL